MLNVHALAAPNGRPVALDSRTRPVAVDLFAGAGGFSLGFEQAGFDVVAAVEYDPVHAAVHSFNFPKTEVLCTDASQLAASDLRDAVKRGLEALGRAESWNGEIAVVFGGPPCQGFSTGGKRAQDDARNKLTFDFKRLVVALRPAYFAMENVPAMKSFVEADGANESLLDRLVAGFESAGYQVLPPRIVNASQHGVPQDRRRLIVIGARDGLAAPAYPEPTVRPVPKRPRDSPRAWEYDGSDAEGSLPAGPTVWDAIGDLPDVDSFSELWESDEVELSREQLRTIASSASEYVRRLRGLGADPSDYSYPRSWDGRVLTSSMRTRHKLTSQDRFTQTKQGEQETTSRFYRLHSHGLCSTIRAGTGYERGSFMAPRPIHPTAHRVISVREAARLHSFPDWFRFHVTKWHGFRQIGNALPPLLGRAIAAEIAKALDASPAKPIEVLGLGAPEVLELSTAKAAERLGADPGTVPSHKLRTRRKSATVDSNENLAA